MMVVIDYYFDANLRQHRLDADRVSDDAGIVDQNECFDAAAIQNRDGAIGVAVVDVDDVAAVDFADVA